MEDIKFHKFVCYILNCISENKTFIYQDGKYQQVDYEDVEVNGDIVKKSKVSFKDLNNNVIYKDGGADIDGVAKTYADILDNNKTYFNIQQVPLYITSTDDKTLDIKKSIYQIFNILKASFNAKKWHSDNNIFIPNKPSPQTVQLTSQFIGGDLTDYEKFLQNVIKAFISLLNNTVSDIDNLKMYVLSKINYYIAKEYVKLVFNKIDSDKQADANKPYEKSDLEKFKIYNGTYDDKHYPQYYQKEILDTMNIYVEKTNNENEAKELFKTDAKAVVKLFNTIKPFLKKQPTVFYQTPITTYTYNPTNIRPLIYRRASEYDLSNFATQIASDAFLNKNKLPVIYDFEKVTAPIAAVGGCSDVNNSSNVYRTIYVKILNILNAKRITLQKTDKDAIETKLNELEQTEHYLKEQLGNYAKYVSATQDKDKTIGYSDVQKFLNEYEDKIKKYNSNTAKIIRFIGRLTPYLY